MALGSTQKASVDIHYLWCLWFSFLVPWTITIFR